MAGDSSGIEQNSHPSQKTKLFEVQAESMERLNTSPGVSFEDKDITLENGELIQLPSIHIGRMRLFHGTKVSGVKAFNTAEETTLGNGLYLTSSRESATGYAIVRSKIPFNPIVYEVEIENMNILNLTTALSLDSFAQLLRQEINKLRNELASKNLPETRKVTWANIYRKSLEQIDNKRYSCAKDLSWHYQDQIPIMLSRLGYDGLMSLEGGESGNGITIGDHDTYVIFEPKRGNVISEQQVASLIPNKGTTTR